jgi:hypothetical protein
MHTLDGVRNANPVDDQPTRDAADPETAAGRGNVCLSRNVFRSKSSNAGVEVRNQTFVSVASAHTEPDAEY